ncbi:MAG TPA: ATP-binding protein [Roseiflexaceae bacterium]|nr:ATP-binding protein [Roseiflexaceae bacterium]
MIAEDFLAIARALPEPMLLLAGDGRILAANPAACQLLGVRGEALSGRTLPDLATDPAEQVAAYLAACARSGAMVMGALTFQMPAGETVLCRCEGAVVRPAASGAPALILLRFQRKESATTRFLLLNRKIDELSREVHERRRAEAEAFRQREQLRVTLASIGDAVIATDPQGAVTFMNPVAEALTGWRQAEALGKPLQEVFHVIDADTRAPAEDSVAQVLRGGAVVGLTSNTLLAARHGAKIPIADSVAPIRDSQGALTGVVLVFRDVTEQRRREQVQAFLGQVAQALAASLDYETTLASIAHLAVPFLADWCVVDLVTAEGAMARLVATHADPAKEQWAAELRRSYAPAVDATPIGEAIRSGRPTLMPHITDEQLAAMARDADHLRLLRSLGLSSAMILPLQARGQTLGALTFVAGESGRHYGPEDLALAEEVARQAAQAIDNARLYQEAQAAVHVRDSFISIAAHELRTPLTALMGNVHLLLRRMLREEPLAERNRHPLQVIADQSARLNRMVHTLLDVSRIETGQLRIERAPVDLSALARQVVDELQPALERHTLEYSAPGAPLLVEGDALRLEQVLQNLLSNAVKYSPAGGPVAIQLARHGDYGCVSVRDEGMGIPSQDLPRLFQRFSRASNAERQYISGMGIGLYVVQHIVAAHGGTVAVESAEGRGSTFTICLPLAERS